MMAARLLIVDDEASIRTICERTLIGPGREVATVSSGEEALGRLSEGWDIIDCVQNDVREFINTAAAKGNTDILRDVSLGRDLRSDQADDAAYLHQVGLLDGWPASYQLTISGRDFLDYQSQ